MDLQAILELVLAIAEKLIAVHWPFVAVALLLGFAGEIIKSLVIGENEEEAEKTTWKKVFNRTLPFHPVIVGGLLGIVLGITIPEVVAVGGVVSSVLYFSLAGMSSTWLFKTIKRLAPKLVLLFQSWLNNLIKSKAKKEPADPGE